MASLHRVRGDARTLASAPPRRRRNRALLCVLLFATAAVGVFLVRSAQAPRARVADDDRNVVPHSPARRWLAAALPDRAKPEVATLSGHVRSASGAAIGDALVCASCASCDAAAAPPALCTHSDPLGRYAFTPHDARAVLIAASAQGYAHGYANRGLPLRAGERARSDLDITLDEGGARIAGVVLDALGGPIAGARLQLLRFTASVWSSLETHTDAEGRFALWTAPGHLQLRAEASGYAPTSRGLVAPSEAVELRLTPASVVRGRVVHAVSGEAIADVRVQALSAGSALPRSAGAISDAAGKFELPSLDPGRYTLVADAAHWRGGAEQPLEVGLVETIDDVLVRVVPAVSVFARVLVGRGDEQPCPRGMIALEPPLPVEAVDDEHVPSVAAPSAPSVPSAVARIEPDGSAVLTGLTPGRYRVTLQCLEHTLAEGPTSLEIADRDLDVVWRTEPGIGLDVKVVDELGEAVPHARVTLLAPAQPYTGGLAVAIDYVADEHGLASIEPSFTAGHYQLAPGPGATGEQVAIELHGGIARQQATLRLHGSGAIVVTALDVQGRGVAGLELTAQAQSAAQSPPAALALGDGAEPAAAQPARAVELGAGRYRIGPLPAGSYVVEANDGVNPARNVAGPAGTEALLSPGHTLELQLRFERGGKLHGKVIDEQGQPEADVWVTARSDEERSTSAWLARVRNQPGRVMTDHEGEFAIDGLESNARYVVEAKQPYGAAAALHGVAEGQRVTIVLPAATATEPAATGSSDAL